MLAFALPTLFGQGRGFRPQPKYVTPTKPDQAEGARILREFQRVGIGGTYWLSFELRVMPRQGPETTVSGKMTGKPGDPGPLTRIAVGDRHWLVQSGPQPVAWVADKGSPVRELTAGETLEPVAGTDLSIFDLQMPFFYWTDFVYEGLTRVRGRPAESFVLYPPADLAAARPELTGVRVQLDSQFHALVQAELLGADGVVRKTISILDLKKVGERWIPKSIDIRNHQTRGKTRFNVTAAALDLELPGHVFEPEGLGEPLPEIPTEKVQPL